MQRDELEKIAAAVIDAAFRIHRTTGPGLRESFYASMLAKHVAQAGLRVEREKKVSYIIDGTLHRDILRVDLLVEGVLPVEVKCRPSIRAADVGQLLTYLRVLDLRLGLVLNFRAELMKNGIRRVANGL